MHATPNGAIQCGCKYPIRSRIRYQLPYQLRRNRTIRNVWDFMYRSTHSRSFQARFRKAVKTCSWIGTVLLAGLLLALLLGALTLML